MPQPFIGEIDIFASDQVPPGWLRCDGQVEVISDFRDLFNVIGNTYGGDGKTTFGVPDLRGRVPVSTGSFRLAQSGGEQQHTLTSVELPKHSHRVIANKDPGGASPDNTSRLAASGGQSLYGPYANVTPLSHDAVGSYGNGRPHENMAPFQTLNFCIAYVGLVPAFD
jgi:microcystin-dependent protein